MQEHKILFTGTVGAGKTTAIAAISDRPPISTDVRNADQSVSKVTTTVGMDYGELSLPNGEQLRLYGTPGQERFDFMWSILAKGALGLVILIDNSRPQPLQDLSIYLKGFAGLIQSAGCVIAIGRMDTHAKPDLEDYSQLMAQNGVVCPLIEADVRDRKQVLSIIELLLMQIEAKEMA